MNRKERNSKKRNRERDREVTVDIRCITSIRLLRRAFLGFPKGRQREGRGECGG